MEDPLIYVVHINNKNSIVPDDKKQKVFIVFGEHARELISPETGLQLVNILCKNKNVSDKRNIDDLLEKNNFALIINANPNGRRSVELGNYCKRTNENNVDLNRNWNSHWILVEFNF